MIYNQPMVITPIQDEAANALALAQLLINRDMAGEEIDGDMLLLARAVDSLGQTVAALTIGLQIAAEETPALTPINGPLTPA